jgi:hypothetical protein
MFPTGFYAVRNRESNLGFAFYREYRLARMRADMTGEGIIYFTRDEFELHMELYFASGIRYED